MINALLTSQEEKDKKDLDLIQFKGQELDEKNPMGLPKKHPDLLTKNLKAACLAYKA